MTPSASCAAFIKGYEKCWKPLGDGKYIAYKPTPDDVWTCGWGSTGRDIINGTIWTQAQCDTRFTSDLAKVAQMVQAAMSGAPSTTQGQFDAMVSLAYNIGTGGFLTSSVLTNHRNGHLATAAWAFGLWTKQRGSDGRLHVLNGLVKRRSAEAAMYSGKRV